MVFCLTADVVDNQLRCLLGVGCLERPRLAACVQHARHRAILVRGLLCSPGFPKISTNLVSRCRRQALPAIAVGTTIISVIMVLNGTVGARLHVSFPVLNRSSFGFWFSYFSVISRMVLSMFWLSVQAYTGSQCVYQMLKAIWPSIARMPNHLSPSANITTSGEFAPRSTPS